MSVGASNPPHGAQLASSSPASDQPGVARTNGTPTQEQSINASSKAARYFIFTTWTIEHLHASRLTGKWRFPDGDGSEPAVPGGMLQPADALRAARLRNMLAWALDVGIEVFAIFLDQNSRELYGYAQITGMNPRSFLASGAVTQACSHVHGLRTTTQEVTRRIENPSANGPSHAPELNLYTETLDSEQRPKMRELMSFDPDHLLAIVPRSDLRSASPTDRVEEPAWSSITLTLDLEWITTQRMPLREVVYLHNLGWPADPFAMRIAGNSSRALSVQRFWRHGLAIALL
ncbi:hypothetical protein MIND_01148600 [Mycena indigotica]|uniref:Uncharacterized protein n=1 Tax=Mycena indigotica TaxID=2126181 RepID=A0A8H6VVR1_9AGAR|nr:uncharacterized protein MIND_01148600 [Mycena indigotica]KAF7293686.1 hypothetical protein MIND_01148600 [Mycena indigotica]